MKRVVLTLSLAVAVGLLLSNEAKAMTTSQAMAVQAAQQAVAHPGPHHGWHPGHHWGPHHPPFGGPMFGPFVPPPVLVYGPQPYYGYPGGVVIRGRGWGFGIAF